MSQISENEKARIARAYRYIISKDGNVFVDGTEAMGSNTVVNAVIQVEVKFGLIRAKAMVNAIERWGNYASEGHRVSIFINTNIGALTGTTDKHQLTNDLIVRIKEGYIPLGKNDSSREKVSEEKGEIQVPPDGESKENGQDSDAWKALLDFAAKVGNDVYELIKGILTGEYTLVNTLGTTRMKANDRLCVFVQNVDDQAEIYIDDELIGARSLGEPGVWDYSDPIKPGKHMVMIVLNNSGRFDYSIFARICRASDYVQGGSQRPILDLARSGNDGLGAAKRVYYLKMEVI